MWIMLCLKPNKREFVNFKQSSLGELKDDFLEHTTNLPSFGYHLLHF
jgi:hypothetical protein